VSHFAPHTVQMNGMMHHAVVHQHQAQTLAIVESQGLTFQLGPNMKHVRGYHSAALLLPDGSVVMGGDPNGGNTPNERYLPPYFFKPRPGYSSNLTPTRPSTRPSVVRSRRTAIFSDVLLQSPFPCS
jgi:hypothetical protein